MAQVSRRGGFSDRNGIKNINMEIQLKDFDKRTRIQLQNMISNLYGEVYSYDLNMYNDDIQEYLRFVLSEIYSEPINVTEIYRDSAVIDLIRKTILEADYDDVLTLIEGIVQYWSAYLKEIGHGGIYYDSFYEGITSTSIFEKVNQVLKKEFVGYRFVNEIIVPISDEYEIDAISEALDTKYKPVYDHLSKANGLLADRDNPDYENSIKESISAIEAICEIITGTKGREATLGKMLKKIEERGIEIHSGLKSAFNILYGYTSDACGIRHAGDLGGKSSTFEEAKFVLVSCSAFINYLTALSANYKGGQI